MSQIPTQRPLRGRWVPPRTEKLLVFLRERMVGTLERRGPSRYRFAYSEEAARAEWNDPMARLSASLPLREERFKPSASAPFFEGLLPEGAVRATVAKKLRLSEGDGFAMLGALGADCAGAVTVLPAGEQPRPSVARARPLDEGQLGAMLRDLPRDPLGIDLESDGVRLSLGGVQDKLVLIRLPSGGFAQPLAGTPSTCLLKPEHDRYEALAVNEAFCMQVAAAAGNEVAATEVLEPDGVRCLYVERFDRLVADDGSVQRLHQEDMCQALAGFPRRSTRPMAGLRWRR